MSRVVNLNEFVRSVSRFEVDSFERFHKVYRAIAFTAMRQLILATPVDTGRARGAWQVGDGVVPTGEPGTTDKVGSGAIAREAPKIENAKPFGVLTIANNVPYIVTLENGSSRQAPAGMLRLGIAAALSLGATEL